MLLYVPPIRMGRQLRLDLERHGVAGPSADGALRSAGDGAWSAHLRARCAAEAPPGVVWKAGQCVHFVDGTSKGRIGDLKMIPMYTWN